MGFKDLMKSFLYESVEDDDEEEYEEEEEEVIPSKSRFNTRSRRKQKQEDVEEPIAPASNARVTTTTSNYNPYANQERYPSNQELYTQPKVTYPATSQGQGRSRIDVRAEQEPPKTTPSEKSRTPLPSRRGNRQNVQPRQEYSTVISPIFGNMADEEKNPRAVHDAINLPKSLEPGGIGQIISPMYGATPTSQPASPIIHIQSTSSLAQPTSFEEETQVGQVASKKVSNKRQKTLSAPSKIKKAAPSQEKRSQTPEPMTQIISTRPQAIRQQMEAQQTRYEEVDEYEAVVNPSYGNGHLARPEILEEALEDLDLQERADQIANEHLAQSPQVLEEGIEEVKASPKPARYLDLSSYLSRGSTKSKSATSDKKKK